MKINLKQTKLFSKISKDTNQIHLNKKFASKFFVKEPIVHGVNLAIFALSEFLKKKKKEILIKSISLNFKNFISVNEKFKLSIFKDRIIIYNEFHTKLEIFLEYKTSLPKKQNLLKIKDSEKKFLKFKFKKLINFELIKQIIYSSYYVGSINPGNGSLILNIKLDYNKNYYSKINPYVEKKIQNMRVISYQEKFFKAQIIACKLLTYKKQLKKLRFQSKTLNKLKSKKILVFGLSSDLGERFNSDLIKKSGCKIYKHSFRINIEKPNIKYIQKKILKKKILKIKPNYIFYFSSPKIFYDEKKNTKLYNFYKAIYVDYFKLMINVIKKNKIESKIFYPSTVFLNDKKKYVRYKSYLSSKQLAERICKSKENKKLIYCVRLPKLISRSNYNLLGFYEGESIKVLDDYIEKFF